MAIIAVVEDTPEHSAFICKALRKAEHAVHLFETEAAAIDAFKSRPFDATVLDLQLAGDRWAGLRVLESVPKGERSLVLVLTDEPDIKTFRPLMLNLGAWDYVPKPIEEDTLILKMGRLLSAALIASLLPQTFESLFWDPGQRCKMQWKKANISIPETAYRIVCMLATADGRAVPFRQLFEVIETPTKNNLFTHIKIARQAFKAVDHEFDAIRSIPGKGYCWIES